MNAKNPQAWMSQGTGMQTNLCAQCLALGEMHGLPWGHVSAYPSRAQTPEAEACTLVLVLILPEPPPR